MKSTIQATKSGRKLTAAQFPRTGQPPTTAWSDSMWPQYGTGQSKLEQLLGHITVFNPTQWHGEDFSDEPTLKQVMFVWEAMLQQSTPSQAAMLQNKSSYRFFSAHDWEQAMQDMGEKLSAEQAMEFDESTPVLIDTIGGINPRQYRLHLEPGGSLYAYIQIPAPMLSVRTNDPARVFVQVQGQNPRRIACHLYKLELGKEEIDARMHIEVTAAMSRWNDTRLWRQTKNAFNEFDQTRFGTLH